MLCWTFYFSLGFCFVFLVVGSFVCGNVEIFSGLVELLGFCVWLD